MSQPKETKMAAIIAHRGASFEAPENTLSAIKTAIQLGADYVEIDVYLSKDGIPVVIHDSNIKRTTNCLKNLYVTSSFLREIRAYDAGVWFSPRFKGEQIPTLREVLELDWGECGLMIEIKRGPYSEEKITQAVLNDLTFCRSLNKIKIGSFEIPILNQFLQSGFKSLIGIVEKKRMLKKFIDLPFLTLAIWHPLISLPLMEFLHTRQIEVWSFTIDDPHLVSHLINLKIDGIITNNPRLLK